MMTQQDRARWLPSALALLLLWVPATTSASPASVTRATTSTVTDQIPTVCTVWPAVNATHSANSQEHVLPSRGWGLHVLFSLLAVLLLLLGGTSLLAWRMVRRRSKARENLEPLQDPGQGPCKDNLHYSSVVFNHQSQDSKDKAPSRKPLLEETEYRVIRA
ncbi:CD300a molecule [Rhinolophus ferrumequinum]|uniref:CD300a molecule n=1 Tax=Rhinolophus ferrumequinum TaxID=59479 RepID=A0A7J7TCM5_RHIFE|nr:CD300a molecule [Rhinolophus ferrumequinum]